MSTELRKINILVPQATHDLLVAYANQYGRSVSNAGAVLIKAHLEAWAAGHLPGKSPYLALVNAREQKEGNE